MNKTKTNQITTKICNRCNKEKSTDEFYVSKNEKCGFRSKCKICYNLSIKQYRFDNPEFFKQYYKNRRLKNRNKFNQNNKKWRLKNPNYINMYRLKNYDRVNKKSNQRRTTRLKTDINYKIIQNCRSRINNAIRNNQKSGHTIELLMCSIPELKLHLEKQFRIGMTWKNYGYGKYKWNIDHIIPCSFFNMLDPVEQYVCFRYQNLQPLWQTDNFKKGNKFP